MKNLDVIGNKELDPHPVSRGLNLHPCFIGMDSLYLVIEYPHRDIFDRWASKLKALNDLKLHEGIVCEDFVLPRGANWYKMSVWDGDARLYLTDRVEEKLYETRSQGQGVGMMVQLSPI